MPEEEVVLRQESGVKAHESDSPPTVGLRAGAFAEVGTLILTDRRLVYVSKGGSSRAAAWVLGGALVAGAVEKRISKAELDDLMNSEGSYSIPLQEITGVEAGRKMGLSYVRVDNRTSGVKPVHSYVLSGSRGEDWVYAINSAINATRSSQTIPITVERTQVARPGPLFCASCGAAVNSGAKFCQSCGASIGQPEKVFPPPPPPPTPATPMCPYCGNALRFIQQYQRWYCDREQRYV